MSDAQTHAKIAAEVYPDADIDCKNYYDYCMILVTGKGRSRFDLLETDSEAKPTTQAKASALDVLVWLRSEIKSDNDDCIQMANLWEYIDLLEEDNPCAAIFNAAKQIVEGKP